jgi:hypothetical protein
MSRIWEIKSSLDARNRGKENMKKQSVLPSIVLIAVLAISMLGFQVWTSHSVEAQETSLKVVNPLTGNTSFNFTDAEKSVGDTFVVNITIVDVTDLHAWQIRLSWDASLLWFMSLVFPSDDVFHDLSPIRAPTDSSVPGTALSGSATGEGVGTFNGTGTLCQITLMILTTVSPAVPEVSCDLTFANPYEDTYLFDSQGGYFTFVPVNGFYDYARKAITVLHVSAFSLNEVQQVIDIAGASGLFEITQVALSEFNAGAPANLSKYDVIVFGISNRYESGTGRPGTIERISELKTYVEEGGGLVWTHDSLEHGNDYGPDAEDPAGVDYGLPGTAVDIPLVKICAEHEVLHCPYEIGSVNSTVPVLYTHTWYGHVTNATIVLMSDSAPADQYNYYLTLNAYGEGRVALIEISDSIIDYDGNVLAWPSQKESMIFANTLYWVSRGEQGHNVAIVDIQPWKTVVGKGYCANVSVPVSDRGNYTESFNVTINANTTVFGIQTVTLDGKHSAKLVFTWNTSDYGYANYTLEATADNVTDEIHTIDNDYMCTVLVHIGVPGDISGPMIGFYDGTCNMRDIQYLIIYFNTNPSSPNWKPNADINNDGTVNMRDITIAILKFNQHE